MDTGDPAKGVRELDNDDLKRLLLRLDEDPERASEKYQRLIRRLILFCFRHNEYLRADELADRALDEVAKKPDLQEITDVERFAVGVLRMLLKANSRKHARLQPIVEDQDFPSREQNPEHTVIDRIDGERKLGCFIASLKRLKAQERTLILEYYPNDNSNLEERRRRLAELLGIERGALATRMNRLRSKLEKRCLDCYARKTNKKRFLWERWR